MYLNFLIFSSKKLILFLAIFNFIYNIFINGLNFYKNFYNDLKFTKNVNIMDIDPLSILIMLVFEIKNNYLFSIYFFLSLFIFKYTYLFIFLYCIFWYYNFKIIFKLLFNKKIEIELDLIEKTLLISAENMSYSTILNKLNAIRINILAILEGSSFLIIYSILNFKKKDKFHLIKFLNKILISIIFGIPYIFVIFIIHLNKNLSILKLNKKKNFPLNLLIYFKDILKTIISVLNNDIVLKMTTMSCFSKIIKNNNKISTNPNNNIYTIIEKHKINFVRAKPIKWEVIVGENSVFHNGIIDDQKKGTSFTSKNPIFVENGKINTNLFDYYFSKNKQNAQYFIIKNYQSVSFKNGFTEPFIKNHYLWNKINYSGFMLKNSMFLETYLSLELSKKEKLIILNYLENCNNIQIFFDVKNSNHLDLVFGADYYLDNHENHLYFK